MAGFRSLARQVRDPRCDLALRRYSLRKCLERFAPYGHRATWDHLCSRAGFGPEDRSPDPARLVEWQPGDGWEPICAALGVAVPDEPFPHENTTADFRGRQGLADA